MSEILCPQLFIALTADIDESQSVRLSAYLDENEISRAGQFQDWNVRRDFIAAHALRRMALSRCFPGPSPRTWMIEGGGRPVVLGRPDIAVSLSHTKGLVATAIATACQLGVDAEAVDASAVSRQTAQTFCTPREQQILVAAGDDGPSVEGFFTLWTLKESLLKATGTAIATPPEAIEFSLSPIELRQAPASFGNHWSFWTFRMGAYRISLAVDATMPLALPSPIIWDLASNKPISDAG